MHEQSIHECGGSTLLTMNEDYAGHFTASEIGTCWRCQALAVYRRRLPEKHEPNGEVVGVRFTTKGMVDDQGQPFRQEVPRV